MVPAMPLIPTERVESSEILMRLVALESLVERLAAKNDHLEALIAHHKASGSWDVASAPDPDEPPPEAEPAPATEPEAPVETPADPEAPAEEPADAS